MIGYTPSATEVAREPGIDDLAPPPGGPAFAWEAGDAPAGPRDVSTCGQADSVGTMFQGRLVGVTVGDVVQWICLLNKTGVLTVNALPGRTSVYIERGAVIHAENGSCRAEDALLHILWLSEATFAFTERPLECEKTIVADTESLVLRAALAAEEAERTEADPARLARPSAA